MSYGIQHGDQQDGAASIPQEPVLNQWGEEAQTAVTLWLVPVTLPADQPG